SQSSLLVQPGIVDRTRDLVGDDGHEVSIVVPEGAWDGTLDREHPDQIVANEQRNGDLTLGVGKTRHRDRVSQLRLSTRLLHLAPLCRGVGALVPTVAYVH